MFTIPNGIGVTIDSRISIGRIVGDDHIANFRKFIGQKEKLHVTISGKRSEDKRIVHVRVDSTRLMTYRPDELGGSIECQSCGIRANIVLLETDSRPNSNTPPHFNFYYFTGDLSIEKPFVNAERKDFILMTSDHIYPRSRGGSDTDITNRQCLCLRCNSKKGNHFVENAKDILVNDLQDPVRQSKYHIIDRNIDIDPSMSNDINNIDPNMVGLVLEYIAIASSIGQFTCYQVTKKGKPNPIKLYSYFNMKNKGNNIDLYKDDNGDIIVRPTNKLLDSNRRMQYFLGNKLMVESDCSVPGIETGYTITQKAIDIMIKFSNDINQSLQAELHGVIYNTVERPKGNLADVF
jgi:5-methylcytosine-specific restriction endonuclease McrA